MLRTETVSPELLKVLRQLMEVESLHNFRLVGGTALSLQLGHRDSVDIDLFSYKDFPAEKICTDLSKKFKLERPIKAEGGIMIRTSLNGVKVDIVNNNSKFIYDVFIEDGIRMATLEDIAAMKIKIICDPFTGRKTKKDLADVAYLLDKLSLKEMVSFFKEKYPTMAAYEESVILRLKDFDDAEKTILPKMLNGMTWEKIKQKIQTSLKEYFDGILKEREKKLKNQ